MRPQRIQRDDDRGAGHRERRDQGRSIAENRDRHRNDVIERRKPEIASIRPLALRAARSHRKPATAARRGRPRRPGPRKMRRRNRRDRDIGGRERRRVVETVADHQHMPSGLTQGLQPRDLVGGLEPGGEGGNPELARDFLDRLAPVAGEDLDREARLESRATISRASGRRACRTAKTTTRWGPRNAISEASGQRLATPAASASALQ